MVKRFLIIFLPILFLLGGALEYLYELEIDKSKALLMTKEIGHVKFQSKVLASHLQNIISDFNIIADLHELKQLTSTQANYDPLDLGSDFISISSRKGIYDQIRVLDIKGMEVVRVDYNNGNPIMIPKEKLQNKADRYYFRHTVDLKPEELFISPLDLNLEQGEIERPLKPVIRLGKTLLDKDGAVRYVLTLNVLATDMLNEFKKVGAGSAGHNSLLNSDGFWLAANNPENEWGFMFDEKKDRTFGKVYPEAWKKIKGAESGQFINESGLFTFAKFVPITEGQHIRNQQFFTTKEKNRFWLIVSHFSADTFYRVLHVAPNKTLDNLLFIYLALVGSTGVVAFIVSKNITSRLSTERELRRSDETTRLLLQSTGESIYGTDLEGNCNIINPACVKTLGFDGESELLGKNMHKLIHHTRADGSPYPAEECRMYQAFRDSKGTHVDDEIFWRKDGTSFDVEYRSHPIFREGEIVGAVAVFTDITERKKAELALIESENRYRQLFDNATDLVITVDLEGNITSANKVVKEMTGYSVDEIVDMRLDKFMSPDNFDKAMKMIEAKIRGEGKTVYELELTLKNGKTVDVEVSSTIMLKDGIPVGTQAFIRDISERKKIESELEKYREHLEDVVKARTSELHYQKFAMDQHAVVSATDVHGNITYANDKFCNISGYSRQELIGENHRIIKSDEHPPEFYAGMWRTVASGKVWHGEVKNIAKDGTYYWVKASIVPFMGENGKPDQYISIRTDITDRKKVEEELKKSRQRIKILLETTIQGLWLIDNNRITKDLNPAMCEILGRAKEEIIGRDIYDFVDEENRAIFVDQIKKRAKGDKSTYEIYLRRPDGTSVPCLFNATPLFDEAGIKTGSFAMVTNISERMEMENELRHAKMVAEKANSAKSTFISSMSHELRTPLNAIIGFSQLLLGDKQNQLSKPQNENANRILHSGEHLLELINELLDLSTIEAGKLSISITKVELTPVIKETLLNIAPLAQNREIAINCNEPGTAHYVDADVKRLKQIFLNIFSNAVKYNNRGGQIDVSCETPHDGMLRTSVTDTGPGISEEKLKILFDPFSRLGAETSNVEGTGIGLTITKKLVEAMNGHIGVKSEVGKGSTFYVDLPVSDLPKAEENRPDDITEEKADVKNDVKTKCLLYIEDNLSDLLLVKNVLSKRPNVKILHATEAKTGIELALNNRPDVILLDISLPDMNGYQALKILKTDDKTRDIPVVAISADATFGGAGKDHKSGFVGYITKPLNLGKFMDIVDTILDDRREGA